MIRLHTREVRLLDWIIFLCIAQFTFTWGYKIRSIPNIDLPAFFRGVQLWIGGLGSPYNYSVFNSNLPTSISHVWPFVYPPSSLLLLSPLGFFSYENAQLLWLALNHALILGCLAYLVNVGRQSGNYLFTMVFVLYVLNFNPLHHHLMAGQVNLFVLVGLLFFWKALRDERWDFVGGCALGFAIILKTYPIFFLAYVAVARRGRLLIVTLLFTLFLVLLAAWLVPGNIWTDWYHITRPAGGYGRILENHPGPGNVYNQSLNGLYSRIGEFLNCVSLSTALTYLTCTTFFLSTVLMSISGTKSVSNVLNNDHGFFLFLLLIPLIAPYTWEHHLTMVLPACFGVLRAFWLDGERLNPLRRSLGIIGLLLTAASIPYDHPELTHSLIGLLFIPMKTYGLLCLWFFFALDPRRQPVATHLKFFRSYSVR